ncbi:MAG TPA: ABC transporter permease [Opitutaceae bacterium]|nr:ABC transporter permease [Opitutaceae bacterium]
MLSALLAKDFARARRNPLPWLIFLLAPLCVAGLIGFAFGGAAREQQIGRLRFALVDEDDTIVSRLLRGGVNQGNFGGERRSDVPLEPLLLERAPALAQLNDNELSAVVIIPKGFSAGFLEGRKVALELIKNPAESIKPTIIEEGLGILTAGLDGIGRNFAPELAAWRDALQADKPDLEQIGPLLTESGRKIHALETFLNPPLVGYTKPGAVANGAAGAEGGKRSSGFNLYGHLLLGMAAMFLLFLGGTGMGDLHREIELRTLARYQTLHVSLAPFLVAKVVFTGLMLMLCAAIILGSGMAAFGVTWHRPLALAGLTLAYAVFVAGLMAVVVAWIPDQRKADPVRSMLSMLLAFGGGCAFPPEMMPDFFQAHVMPLLPTQWFVATARAVEYGGGDAGWLLTAGKLTLVGAALLAAAAAIFRRRFAKGVRA